ncbi:hypothetical protein AVEN_9270-1, partial [Araneus ventricosus]
MFSDESRLSLQSNSPTFHMESARYPSEPPREHRLETIVTWYGRLGAELFWFQNHPYVLQYVTER